MRSHITILFVAVSILLPRAHSFGQSAHQGYLFRHFDTSDGLPSNFANAVVQDRLGFLWFLHDNGLSRYDGYEFKIYRQDSTDHLKFSGNSREGMLILDNTGELWIVDQLTKRGEGRLVLIRHRQDADSFTSYLPDVGDAFISCALFDKKKPELYMGSLGHGLFKYSYEYGLCENVVIESNAHNKDVNTILHIHDEGSTLLLATAQGLWRYDKNTKEITRPPCDPGDINLLYHSRIVFIAPSGPNQDSLWIVVVGSKDQFVLLDKNLLVRHREMHPSIDGESLAVDADGSLWFTTHTHGLYKYDQGDSSFTGVGDYKNERYGLRSSFLRGLLIDRDNNIWVTTTDRGISRISSADPRFFNFAVPGEVTGRAIHSIDGVSHLILSRRKTSDYGEDEILAAPIIRGQIAGAKLHYLFSERRSNKGGMYVPDPYTRPNNLAIGKRHLWIGTWRDGIAGVPFRATTGGFDTSSIVRFRPDPQNPKNTLSGSSTTALWEQGDDILWAGTRGAGLNRLDLRVPYGEQGSVIHYRHSAEDSASISSDVVWWRSEARDRTSFWIVTNAGIDLFQNGMFHHQLSARNAMTARVNAKGNLLIGTTDGLYERSVANGKLRKLSATEIQRSGATDLVTDSLGRLWIINHEGLVFLDENENYSTSFSEADDLLYSRDWIDITSSGLIVTSDAHGFSVFDPLTFRPVRTNLSVAFTGLRINNRDSRVNDSDTEFLKTRKQGFDLDTLNLNYLHNHFSIDFAAMQFTAPEKNRYRYKLEGYDNEWIETDWKSRTATYTNLDPGEYTFKVKASNHHGIWSDHETSLTVVILPPPWQTWWAYALYALAIVAALLYWRHRDIKRIKLKNRAQQLAELDRLKTRFFANISHEFRTPLTLILGPLNDLHKNATQQDQKNLLSIMIRNGQRLLQLINQLLDLTRIEAGKMDLRITKIEMVAFLREHAAIYEPVATSKHLRYGFNPRVDQLQVMADKEKLEKVIHNLLSNAFKFTTSGHVTMTLRQNNKGWAEISVEDSGTGIPQDQLDKVFDRFYQADNSQTRAFEGSGLGLALAKEIVELHHGTISVDSKYGSGTTFTITLPTTESIFKKGEIINYADTARRENEYKLTPGLYAPALSEPGNTLPPTASETLPHLLIVEDNADMRTYIRNILSIHYHIREAENGRDALEKASQEIPDLIISDIMMPEMDGYRFCELIKTNELTSHIPVVLLTARADRDSKITGLETKADDYLIKPFDAAELLLIIRNRIEERREMRLRFSKEIRVEPAHIAISSLEERFLRKVLDSIEGHIGDEAYSVEQMSIEAGLSYTQLYRKVKALTGMSPNELLRTMRLKRAAELLKHSHDHVAQVAYSVGFASESYFIKCFKEEFGKTPGQMAGDKTSGTTAS